jgi:hypothetical protein
MTSLLRTLLALATALFTAASLAGPGHDHDHDHGAAPAGGGQASPRFEASSDLFELVGVADGDTLVLYVDRYDNNAPVLDGAIEVEMLTAGGQPLKVAAAAQPDGTYSFKSELLRRPGDYAFQITVTAGQDLDILAGNLTIPAPAADDNAHARGIDGWLLAVGVAGGLVVLAIVATLLRRRRLAGAAA